MKKIILTAFTFLALTSCGFKRYGDFTVLANGNVDQNPKVEKLSSQTEAIVKTKVNDPLESCVDKAVNSVEGGEYMKNVVVYVGKKKIKVVGDVYGVKPTNSTSTK